MKIKAPGRVVLYGFLIWLIPFAVSVLIFPIHETNRPLFESIMPVVGTLCVVGFLILHFGKLDAHFARAGVMVGIIWLAISLAIDLPLFMWGPMKTTFINYMMDIGLTYLAIPIITIGAGYMLDNK